MIIRTAQPYARGMTPLKAKTSHTQTLRYQESSSLGKEQQQFWSQYKRVHFHTDNFLSVTCFSTKGSSEPYSWRIPVPSEALLNRSFINQATIYLHAYTPRSGLQSPRHRAWNPCHSNTIILTSHFTLFWQLYLTDLGSVTRAFRRAIWEYICSSA